MSEQFFHLVVLHAFGTFKRGDVITDAAEVEATLIDHEQDCRRIWKPKDDVAAKAKKTS